MVPARHHRSSKRKIALAADESFWRSPVISSSSSQDMATPSSSASDDDGDSIMLAHKKIHLPPAHHQLLITKDENPSHEEGLKGFDHNQSIVSFDNLDSYETMIGYGYDDDSSLDECCHSKQLTSDTATATKPQKRRSWILGVARLRKRKIAKSLTHQPEDEYDMNPPELVSLPSCTSLDLFDSSVDDSIGDESTISSSTSNSNTTKSRKFKGVSFSETVKIQPIPHCSTLSPTQKHEMYTSNFELQLNKLRNKKEFKYDGYDWRNVTEEWKMCVDMFTGELVHPAHDHLYD